MLNYYLLFSFNFVLPYAPFLQFHKLVTALPAIAQWLRPLYERIWNFLLNFPIELGEQFIRWAILVMDRSVSVSSIWIR